MGSNRVIITLQQQFDVFENGASISNDSRLDRSLTLTDSYTASSNIDCKHIILSFNVYVDISIL